MIEENQQQQTPHQPGAAPVGSYRWIVEWSCLLSTVFLTGSTLSCLFQWFSYRHPWDMATTIFSLVLAGLVYFTSFYRNKIASLQLRLFIATASLAAWAVFLPIILKMAGFK
ncbi:MAG: hypothetical protein ACOYXC_15490 [Candidatus Rifleibacteriota bacterium]